MNKRKLSLSFFCIFLLTGGREVIAADNSGGGGQNIQGITLDRSMNYTNNPEEWINVGELSSTSTYDSAESHTKCAVRPLCSWSTVTINRGGNSWVRPYMSFYTQKIPLTGSDDGAIYNFEFSLTFNSNPIIGITSYNSNNRRKWDTAKTVTTFPSLYEPVKTWTGEELNLGGWCGNLIGCLWAETTYLHSTSPKPNLWIKLPANLKRQSYNFNNIKMMSIYHIERNNSGSVSVSSQEAALYVSGTITLPQRCYSNIDKSQLDFGDVFSNAQEGLLTTRSIVLNTRCYYAPISSKQYITIRNKSGGSLTANKSNYIISSDSSGAPALGFGFGINKSPVCTMGASDAEFQKEYLIRTVSLLETKTYNDIINIGLCKYGIPASIGVKNATIEVVSRWEKN
ncbi:TPA: hypothetical protein ACIJVO_005361 [Klebsiella oxytoca]